MIVKEEIPLGGGEGSVIYYRLHIGNCEIDVAVSRAIKTCPTQKKWVDDLEFLDDFDTIDDIRDILSECDDERLAVYVRNQLEYLLWGDQNKETT